MSYNFTQYLPYLPWLHHVTMLKELFRPCENSYLWHPFMTCVGVASLFLDYYRIIPTCNMTDASGEAGLVYHSEAADVTPCIVFYGSSYLVFCMMSCISYLQYLFL